MKNRFRFGIWSSILKQSRTKHLWNTWVFCFCFMVSVSCVGFPLFSSWAIWRTFIQLIKFLYLHQSQKLPRNYYNKTLKPESSDKHWVLFFLFYCFQKNLLKVRHLSITQLKNCSARCAPFSSVNILGRFNKLYLAVNMCGFWKTGKEPCCCSMCVYALQSVM